MDNHERFKPNDRIYQIFIKPDGMAIVIEATVVEATPESLSYIPLGDVEDVSGKVITVTTAQGIPRSYAPNEIDLMFTEYMSNILGMGKGPVIINTPKSLEGTIRQLEDLLRLWKKTLRKQRAEEAAKDAGAGGESEEQK